MTDKELKDWCKNCDVEPPAMKFKCPECEHSLDNEQMIIDGVDVSGCISFDKNSEYNICCCDDIREDKIPFANFCVENKNCYFKQLARKTQECEALKKRNEDNERFYLKQYAKKDSEVLDLTHKLNVKTQEYEELKKENLAYKQTCENLKNALDESMQECIDLAKVIEEHSQKQRLV